MVQKIDKHDIEIRVLRSKRKSVSGRVLPDGTVEIRAPFAMTAEEINRFLDKYEHKFLSVITQFRETNAFVAEHFFGYGGEMLFRGEWFPIKAAEDDNGGSMARYKDGVFVLKPGLPESSMRRCITDLFFTLAEPVLAEKLRYYSDLIDVAFKSWSLGIGRRQHGSCNSKKHITLSWRIVMMSDFVIDYIIVHELAHLKHMNHSKAFYSEVAKVLPDWKERRKAHAEYCLILRCGGWM